MTGSLVTLGETLGVVATVDLGNLRNGSAARIGIAGSESNVAIGVCRLGGEAVWFGRIGSDSIGDLVLRELRAEQVQLRATRGPGRTGLMIKARLNAKSTRVLYYRCGSAGSRLQPSDLDEATIRSAAVLHVTGVTLALGRNPAAAVHEAVDVAREHAVPVSLDVNYRSELWAADEAKRTLVDIARLADIIFASESEASLLLDAASDKSLAEKLTRLGPRQAIVTCGERGSYACIDDMRYTQPATPVHSIDPVGAGDAYVAGYLAEFMEHKPPGSRLRTASLAGAFAVTVLGDWEGSPTRADLELLTSLDPVAR